MNENLINKQTLTRTGQIFNTLRHPIRIDIIKLLEENKVMNVSALVDILQLEQAAVSHHLIIMKNNKILESKRRGKNTDYYITKGFIDKIEKVIGLLNAS